jgi:hypothetical protein
MLRVTMVHRRDIPRGRREQDAIVHRTCVQPRRLHRENGEPERDDRANDPMGKVLHPRE